MTDEPKESPSTAQALLGGDYREADQPTLDATAYRQMADPRYMAALAQQKAERRRLTPRRRPLLRLVWVNPNIQPEEN